MHQSTFVQREAKKTREKSKTEGTEKDFLKKKTTTTKEKKEEKDSRKNEQRTFLSVSESTEREREKARVKSVKRSKEVRERTVQKQENC